MNDSRSANRIAVPAAKTLVWADVTFVFESPEMVRPSYAADQCGTPASLSGPASEPAAELRPSSGV